MTDLSLELSKSSTRCKLFDSCLEANGFRVGGLTQTNSLGQREVQVSLGAVH